MGMALAAGSKLGQYEVRELIGKGGMGEVYRATDTKLGRDVAIKVLPEMFARDPERVARFRREAKLLASLNHPNIATIHGLEESGGTHFLVMEMVEGETLADMIRDSGGGTRGSGGINQSPERERRVKTVGDAGPLPGGRGSDSGIPLGEALDISKQICEALEHAHESGVIHRDLKPANVKLTPSGKIKVLDFGLAKAFGGDGGAGDSHKPIYDSNSPTVSRMPAPQPDFSPTIPGVIMGTAAYMSPEQAKGKEVDKRTDIWALGVVLYELLTGVNPFMGDPCRDRERADQRRAIAAKDPLANARGTEAQGDEPITVQEILAAVLKSEPDWSLLPADTPPTIRALLRRCLQKDLRNRSRDAAEIRMQLDDALSTPASTQVGMSAPLATPTPASAPRRGLLLGALACVVVAALAATAGWYFKSAPAAAPRPVERVVSPLPSGTVLSLTNVAKLAISPDGRRLVYAASGSGSGRQLYLRQMDALEAVPLPGTEGAYNPFFSPDGEWIGFATGSAVMKISVSGGAALTLCSGGGTMAGAAWGPDNTIVFNMPSQMLVKVSAAGGQPQPFSTLQQGETVHGWPQFLPDGKTVLFSIGTGGSADDGQIAVQRLDASEHKVLIRGGTYPRYVPSNPSAGLSRLAGAGTPGYLVYYRAGTLMAAPFDPVALEVKGSAFPVVEEVAGFANTGVAHFSISDSGSLAYLRGGSQSITQMMVWVNRQGVATPLPAPPRNYRAPRLSPDGRQVAVGIGADVWLYDIPRDTLTRLTFEGNNTPTAAIWTPDSKRVVFPSNRAGPLNLFWKAADGSGPEERLSISQNTQRAGSFSPDGRMEIYTEIDPKLGQDLWLLPMEGDRKPRLFLQTPFQEASGQISPDGHWVAYISDESGRNEVYVRPFPGPGGKWQISTEGGSEAAWSPKGNELFYRTGGQREKMMVVVYQTQPTFSAGKSRLLFEGNYVAGGGAGAFYSVSPDGQRFLMTKTPDQPQATLTQINMVLNWFEELKQKVPVK
jgi:eukaryotic-like serine/threonine-protein kinase